jgi:hypothetical protein
MTTGTMTETVGAAVLKYLYQKQSEVEDMVARKSPLISLLPDKTDLGGRARHVAVITGRPQGRSRTFANAQTNVSAADTVAFDVTPTTNYGVATITRLAMKSSQGDANRVIELLDLQMKGILDSLTTDIARGAFRNIGGARGQTITAAFGVTTITLTDITDVVSFEKDMVIKASTTDGTSGAVKAGSVTLASVDYDAGTLTATGNWSAGIATIAQNDYLFQDGDFGAAAAGLDSWVPASAPGATAFYGVDRSTNPTRLGGIRPNSTYLTGTISERLIRVAALVQRHGGDPSLVVVNPVKWADLEIELENRKRIVELEGKGGFGFKALEMATPNGVMNVVSDPFCQSTLAWMLDPESWCTDSVGELVQVVDEDSAEMLRQSTSDGFEIRTASYYNHWCNAPGHNARISLT